MMKILLAVLILFSSGCSWRVFQSKVPYPVEKTESHLESERVGGDFLARKIENNEQRLVATSLSQSLGLPKEQNDNPQEISDDIKSQIQNLQENQTRLNETLSKYGGKEIEGTGLDLWNGMSWTSIILLIVLIVAFPSSISLLFYLLKQSRSTIKAIVDGVEDFKFSSPQSATSLKNFLSASLDKKHKQLVNKVKDS